MVPCFGTSPYRAILLFMVLPYATQRADHIKIMAVLISTQILLSFCFILLYVPTSHSQLYKFNLVYQILEEVAF